MSGELAITCSRNLVGWLAEQNCSLAVTSYQTGQLFLIGREGETLSVNHSHYPVCMGLDYDAVADELFVATASQIWRLAGEDGENQFDRKYMPRASSVIGDVDPHEIGRGTNGETFFINSEFSCIAVAETQRPVWQPKFIDKLAPEDRCHLNGMAVQDGRILYATAISQSNSVGGWRDRRHEGGVLMSTLTSEIITDKLSMPHSPRVYGENLFVLNSGTGQLLVVDPASGGTLSLMFFPGFLRGLTFSETYAVVGLSLPRNHLFSGLALDDELKRRDAEPWCGVQIANLQTGNVEHWLRFTGGVREVFEVAVLPGVVCPQAVGLNEKFRVTYSEAA